jgi:hypothetical protein
VSSSALSAAQTPPLRSLGVRLLEAACRAGYAARGAVYLSIGAIALLAALDRTPRSEGAVGALEAWADWPFGTALLWLTGIGLYAFAGWRALQSLFDADRQGRSPKALATRAGQAISGVLYAALGVSVFGLLDALEDLREIDDRASTRRSLGEALQMPAGELLILAAGLFVVAVGVGNIVTGIARDHCKAMSCDAGVARGVRMLGRIGYVARGVVFVPTGVLLALAGLHARGAGSQGLGAALDFLERLPFGSWILALAALGLAAFGLFALAEARYRRIRVEAALPD